MEEFPARVVINRYDIHTAPLADPKITKENWAGGISVDFAGLKQPQN
jgi:hypothetical protein